jgi:hypothetical protein
MTPVQILQHLPTESAIGVRTAWHFNEMDVLQSHMAQVTHTIVDGQNR